MSFQSPENQLKEAVSALAELKALTETLKVSAEAKTQADERLAKVESSVASIGEQIESLAKKMPQFIKDKMKEDEVEEEANEIGGVNPTVISTKKKKKQPVAVKEGKETEEEDLVEEEELMDEPVKKKSKKAAEETEEEEEEVEAEAKGGKIPPQFLKHIKKKKAAEEAEEEEVEEEVEAKAAEEVEKEDEEVTEEVAKKAGVPPQFLKNMKKKEEEEVEAKAAEEVEEKEEEVEEKAADPAIVKKMKEGILESVKDAKELEKAKKDTKAAEETEEEEVEEEEEAAKVKSKKKAAEPMEEEEEEEEPKAKKSKKATEEVPAPVAESNTIVNSELELLKAELASQAKSRDEAIASVTKMKAEFDSLMDRISNHEKAEKTAEEKVAKTIASLGVQPVGTEALASDDKPKTPEEIAKEYQALEQTDAREARRFWLKHGDAIRSAAFGKTRHFS